MRKLMKQFLNINGEKKYREKVYPKIAVKYNKINNQQ